MLGLNFSSKLDWGSYIISIAKTAFKKYVSPCVCTTHQYTILLVAALNWEVTNKDLVNAVVCDPSNCECLMNGCTNCPRTNTM